MKKVSHAQQLNLFDEQGTQSQTKTATTTIAAIATKRRYDVVKVAGKQWKITENGVLMHPDGPGTDECAARVYAYIWNVWNGPYKRGEESRCRPLTLKENMDISAIQSRLASFHEESEEL